MILRYIELLHEDSLNSHAWSRFWCLALWNIEKRKKEKEEKTYFRIACIFRPYKDLKELDKTCKMKSMVFRLT